MKPTLFILIFSILFFSCTDSKENLTIQVKKSIEKELTKRNLELFGFETEIIDLTLVKKHDNEYEGILKTHEIRKPDSKNFNSSDSTDNSFSFEYVVSVISDNESFKYEIGEKRLVQW